MSGFVVAIYEMDRAFGGPEEGGWWYDCGTLERVIAACRHEETADRIATRANSLLANQRKRGNGGGRADISSVIYEGGHFEAMVFANTAPEHFPQQIPHYYE
jgi:hypothetical protein